MRGESRHRRKEGKLVYPNDPAPFASVWRCYPERIRRLDTAGREAPEHVAGRLNVVWGIDDGNVGSGTPFYACVGLGMLVHTGLAKLLAVEDRHLTGRTGLDEPRGLGAWGARCLSPLGAGARCLSPLGAVMRAGCSGRQGRNIGGTTPPWLPRAILATVFALRNKAAECRAERGGHGS